MEMIKAVMPVLEIIVGLFDMSAILILIYGMVMCVKDFLISRFTAKTKRDMYQTTLNAKNELGFYILLGLEILIVADIIESIIHPSINEISVLALIVVIRTAISFFLNKELHDAEA